MNRVETFEAESLSELQVSINLWCKSQNIEPLSVSVGYNPNEIFTPYFAAVVVKEL